MSLDDLLAFENYYPTEMGGAYIGERAVLRGKDQLQGLGHLSWTELLFFALTGFEGDSEKISIIEYIWTGCSYSDPRLWNNRVAALAASTRSTAGLALSAGTALSEATIYGQRANVRSIDFMIRIKKAVDQGTSIADFIDNELQLKRRIYGYGRPLSRQDERVQPVMDRINKLDQDSLPHTHLALEVAQHLNDLKGLQINITAISAALAADTGMTARQYHSFYTPAFSVGIIAAYQDAITKPAAAFFPIRCDKLNYIGSDAKQVTNQWESDITLSLTSSENSIESEHESKLATR